MQRTDTDTEKRSCEDRSRDWSKPATHQEMLEATRKLDAPLEPLEGACTCQSSHFRLPVSKTVEMNIRENGQLCL